MSELTPPEPTFPEPPGRNPWTPWGTMASAALHAGALAFFLWQPLPDLADAAQPPAIEVELVPPPEAVSASEPPAEVPEEEAEEPAPEEEPAEEASAATAPPAEAVSSEPPPTEQAAAPTEAAAEMSPPETPSETAVPETISEPSATEASEPVRGSETASAVVAPIPLARPRVRGLTAPESVPDEAISALTADTGEMADEAAAPVPSAEPDVATLQLGPLRSAERFYFEAMLSDPSMARAREVLETLPPERRLAQTCILEALAQIGNAGEGFAPDVVMAEAYAELETTGTRLAASGAIFRSGDNWYGLAFDCTLSEDLTRVTAFSYRLGADVTEAVLARLSRT
jgi:outer membrane biosynthesis protein TonB